MSAVVCVAGVGYHIQNPSLCSNICSSRVELWWFTGDDVEVFVPRAAVSSSVVTSSSVSHDVLMIVSIMSYLLSSFFPLSSISFPVIEFDTRPTNQPTNRPMLAEIIQSLQTYSFGYFACMDDNLDAAKQFLTSWPSVDWKRPLWWPWMSCMKTVQNILNSDRLSWTEAVDLTQNWPLGRLLTTSGKLKMTMIFIITKQKGCSSVNV